MTGTKTLDYLSDMCHLFCMRFWHTSQEAALSEIVVDVQPAALPDHLKNITWEQFLSGTKPGELFSDDELYGILFTASTLSSNVQDFCLKVGQVLDKRFGAPESYVAVLSTGTGDVGPLYTFGDARGLSAGWKGTLSLGGVNYAVSCVVYSS